MFRYFAGADRPRRFHRAVVLSAAVASAVALGAAPVLAEPTSPGRVTFEVVPRQPGETPSPTPTQPGETPTQPPLPTPTQPGETPDPTPTQPGETPDPTPTQPGETPTQPPLPTPTQPGEGELPVSGSSWPPGLFLLAGLLLVVAGAVLVRWHTPTDV